MEVGASHASACFYISNVHSWCSVCRWSAMLCGWLVFRGTGTFHSLGRSFRCLLSFGCLYPLAIVDSGIVNTRVWDFTWTRNFSSFGHTCRSGNAGSYGSSMFIFFWGPAKLSSLAHHCGGRTLLPCIPVVNTQFLLSNPAFLVGVEWHLTVDWNCVFQVTVTILSCALVICRTEV